MPAINRRIVLLGAAAVCAAVGRTTPGWSASLLDQIKQRGSLRIGLEGTYPPFSFQDAGGQLDGFEVDFARAVAAQLGVKPEFFPAPWAGLLGGLEAGRIDVVINQVGPTDERRKKYDFSDPYTVSGIQIIVLKGNEGRISTPADLAGNTVGVGLGTNHEKWVRENVPTAIVKTYDDDPTKYQDLRAGRIDAVLNDRLVAAEFVKKSGGPFVGSGEPFSTEVAAIALPKDADLLAALNQAIASLRASGELARISSKWFGADVTQ